MKNRHPNADASGVVELLEQMIRDFYEHAATRPATVGRPYEHIADILRSAHPHSDIDSRLCPAAAADHIAASLHAALPTLAPDTPEYRAIDRIRRQIEALRNQ